MVLKRVTKNVRFRNLFVTNFWRRKAIKYLLLQNVKNKNGALAFELQQLLQKTGKQSSLSFLRNLCLASGKSRSISRFSRLHRMQVKRLSTINLLSGIRISTW